MILPSSLVGLENGKYMDLLKFKNGKRAEN